MSLEADKSQVNVLKLKNSVENNVPSGQDTPTEFSNCSCNVYSKIWLLLLLPIFLISFALSPFSYIFAETANLDEQAMEEILESFWGKEMKEKFESLDEKDLEGVEDFSFSEGNCFDHYRFGSVQVNVYTEKNIVFLGEEVIFSGELENENSYPVFNGYLYVRISERNPNYLVEGHNVIDEFVALGPLAIASESTLPVSFSWTVPERLNAGEYTIESFFSVNKRMNLSGLPFTNEIIAGSSDFLISGNVDGKVSFLKETTQVNGERYNHIGNWPFINSGEKVIISQKLRNSLPEEIVTTIFYNLYYWDSLDPEDKLLSSSEDIVLKAGETKELIYEIPKVEESVYYLQIVSESKNSTRSIVNIRITSDVSKSRINYFGLNKFPIKSNETATLYSCFHNTSIGAPQVGRSLLVAKNQSGEELARVDYNGLILGDISAQEIDFVADLDLEYLILEQELYDEAGNLLESQEIIYDMSFFEDDVSPNDTDQVEEVAGTFWSKIFPVIVFVLILLAMFVIYLVLVKPSFKFRKPKASEIVVCFSFFLVLFFSSVEVSSANSTLDNFKKQQSTIERKPFSSTFTRSAVAKARGWTPYPSSGVMSKKMIFAHLTPNSITGAASYEYIIRTSAKRSLLAIGDEVAFSHNSCGTYYLSGVAYDTPYLGKSMSLYGKLTMRMDAAKWVGTNTSKGRLCPEGYPTPKSPSFCVGGTVGCPTDFSYDWRNQGTIPEYTEYLKRYSNEEFAKIFPVAGDHRPGYTQVKDLPKPLPTLSSNDKVIDCSGEVCKAVGPGTATLTPGISKSYVILSYACPIPFTNVELLFSGFLPTWEFEVRDINPEEPLCGIFHQNEYPGGHKTWPEIRENSFCAQGELGEDYLPQPEYPDVNEKADWNCIETNGVETDCWAKRGKVSVKSECGTYNKRNYPASIEGCTLDKTDWRWPDACWDLHPLLGSGTFCAEGSFALGTPEFPFPVPPPDNRTRWYCSDGVKQSEECSATRGLAMPWISTRGGLVHVEGEIGLEMRSLLYSDIIKPPSMEEKTTLSSELLTSLESLNQGGNDNFEGKFGVTDYLYTLGDYSKRINLSWYEILLSRAKSRDPLGSLWEVVSVDSVPDLSKCKNGNRRVYFIEEDLLVDPSEYEYIGTEGIEGCIFIAKKDVFIGEGDFKSGELEEKVGYDIVRGFFLVDGRVIIKEDTKETEAFLGFKDGIKIVGGLFATGGGASIELERTLGVNNLDYPTLIAFHDARYLNLAREVFGSIGYIRDIGFKE